MGPFPACSVAPATLSSQIIGENPLPLNRRSNELCRTAPTKICPLPVPAIIEMNDEDEEENVNCKPKSNNANHKMKPVTGAVRYRDFSWMSPVQQTVAKEASFDPKKDRTFPFKLHSILSNPEYEDIIAWLPHGRSWRILQQHAFEDKVIPVFFRHGRYSSFARQGIVVCVMKMLVLRLVWCNSNTLYCFVLLLCAVLFVSSQWMGLPASDTRS